VYLETSTAKISCTGMLLLYISYCTYVAGAWGSVVIKALSDGLGIDSRWCRWGFFSVATDGTMCPGVDSASENEYYGFLLG